MPKDTSLTKDAQQLEMDAITDCWSRIMPFDHNARRRILAWMDNWAHDERETEAEQLYEES